MNYRHAFHAGNHADVLKHLALIFCLDRLREKPSAFGVIDTHAGPGLYDLASDESQRSPEWQDGIGKIWNGADAPALRDAIAAHNPDGALRFYPGSPVLISDRLRDGDRLAACELHPEDAALLKRRFAARPNVQVHARDAWEALKALLPLPEKRGLVLIDPPYEAPDEIEIATAAIKAARARFRQGMYLWWRPLKQDSLLDAADAELTGAGEALRADFGIAPPAREGKLTASSLLVLNPPFGLEAMLRDTLPALARRLGGANGFSRVSRLGL